MAKLVVEGFEKADDEEMNYLELKRDDVIKKDTEQLLSLDMLFSVDRVKKL